MQFESFLGNRKIIERLRAKLREGRFPHAVILSGPEGVGKRTCALMLAKTLNCPEASPGNFCDACSQCRKIDAGTHPDVISIGVEEDATRIKIDQIRELLHTLELRPLEGSNKVFIIDPAESMNDNSANALLKALEEPPENSYFILLSANAGSLLITVRSRSQSYAFTPLTRDEMRQFGAEELALRWARGSIGTLKTLDLAALKERRALVLDFLETAVGAGDEDFRDLIAASGNLARSKTEFDSYMSILAVLLEDVLYIQEDLRDRTVNVDIEKPLENLAKNLAPGQLGRIAEFLRTIETFMTTNVNRQMLTDALAVSANAAVARLSALPAPK